MVFPIAILLLLAVFDVGRAVFLSNSLTNAAREGARFAIVHQNTSDIAERVEAMTFLGSVSNLSGTPSLVGYFQQNVDGSLGAACSPVKVGCIAVVTVASSWTAITPVVGDLIGPMTLTGRSELPVEFVCPNPLVLSFATDASCPKQP